MENLKLEEGEVICSKCEGRGCSPFVDKQYAQETCSKCNGEGKLDWISNAMVKKPIPQAGTFTISNPTWNKISAQGSLIIETDSLELDVKKVEMSDEALESLVDVIEKKLSERKKHSAILKTHP